MENRWTVQFYKTINDESPVEEFITRLDIKAQNKAFEVLVLLQEYGINLRMPHAKKVIGTPLWELRIIGKDNIRIFYVTQTGKAFLILHAFKKKKQKTDKKEIKIALDRFTDHKLRTQN